MRPLPPIPVAASICAFVFLPAGSQSPVSISGISDGQKLSDYVEVSLDAEDLSEYRKVSFCMDGEPYPGVARAPVERVIDAARNGTSVEWMKYNGGEWKEPGLTGLSDNGLAGLKTDL